MSLHPELLGHVYSPTARLDVVYLDATKGAKRDTKQPFERDNIQINYRTTRTVRDLGPAGIDAWRRMYVEGEATEPVLAAYRRARSGDEAAAVTREEDLVFGLSDLEALAAGLPEVR
jgi:hypothetical protein